MCEHESLCLDLLSFTCRKDTVPAESVPCVSSSEWAAGGLMLLLLMWPLDLNIHIFQWCLVSSQYDRSHIRVSRDFSKIFKKLQYGVRPNIPFVFKIIFKIQECAQIQLVMLQQLFLISFPPISFHVLPVFWLSQRIKFIQSVHFLVCLVTSSRVLF